MASSSKLINQVKSWLPVSLLIRGRLNKVRCFHDVRKSKSLQNDAINKRIWTIPNGLCLCRIVLSPLVAYTIINNQPLASVLICSVAGLTDFADGYIARRYENQRSTLGATLDPVADKIMISTLFVSTAISGQLPVLLTSIVIGRDLSLIMGAAYKRYQIMSQPRTVSQFFSLKGLNMNVKSSMISKWNTTFQFTLIILTVGAPLVNMSDCLFLVYFQYLVGATTIVSGIDYIVNRDNYISSLDEYVAKKETKD